jgi:hypothetical protein
MPRRTLIIFSVATLLVSLAGAADRVLTETYPAAGVDGVHITNGVGDVTITAGDVAEISVEITLIPRRGGLFSSFRNAEQDVESARLVSRLEGDTLVLDLESSSDEPRFEARWVVVQPAAAAVSLKLGVGDVTIRGLGSGVELELGVGDAAVEVADGAVDASIGVGDATVRAPADRYGSVDASGGVGGADVIVRDKKITGEGFVGQSSTWHGDGPHSISLEVGVGDARIRLD